MARHSGGNSATRANRKQLKKGQKISKRRKLSVAKKAALRKRKACAQKAK